MTFGLRSLRRRIIALSLLLLAALLASALYIQARVNASIQHYQGDIGQQRAYAEDMAELRKVLYNLESGLYRYATLQDESQREAVVVWLDRAVGLAAKLDGTPFGQTDEILRSQTVSVRKVLADLDLEARELLRIIVQLELRFPAQPTITQKLYPLNVRFMTAVEDAILDAEFSVDRGDRGRQQLLTLLGELRYLWTQQISVVRVYIANRSGVFGMPEVGMRQHLDNRANYISKLYSLLGELGKSDKRGQLGLLQADSMEHMRQAVDDYELHFAELVRLYESDGWRADIPVLRHTIQPLFNELWQSFSRIENRMASITSDSLMGSLLLAGTLSSFIWAITLIAVVVFLLAYLGYEVAVRRPIDQVTYALDALGRGDAYTPLLKTQTYETDRLLNAFREMQNQVQARETRLASILDNASEGIITINDKGVIETFNNAAESLFRYPAEEVLGRNVNILMPQPMRDEHDAYIRRYLETGEQRILGNEINVNAQRKDGTVFPMSIKVGEVVIDGQRYFTAIVTDISERKAMLDHLRHLAEHDSLTGLYNRQFFTDELERVVQRSIRQEGMNSALLYIDLDNFKFVNDTLGHLAGDKVLIDVANLFTRRSRKGDLVARLGGDEFAILLYDVDMEQTMATAESYRQLLAEYQFRYETKVVDVGCSIGVAMFDTDIETREELMARADLSCHVAKRSGRNNVHLYQADDRASMDSMYADMGWARIIKQAIEQDRFVFAMQPIVSMPDRSITSYELLLRMRGDNNELIMPTGFIPSAERFGLILEIDRWVVRHAIELLAQGGVAGEARISINLSAMAIGDHEVLRLVTDGIDRHGVDPRRIGFEITETIAVADLGAAAEFLARLRVLGCVTALDDFGVGYCSFAYLKDLPVDYVKIDGSFVRDIAKDSVQLAMVKSMNEIAHAMGKKTIAEYVDNEQVMQLLNEIGVDYAQGYLTGRPRLTDGVADA